MIDKNGKIVFKGHPEKRSDLEKDFDDLLAGKEILVDREEEEEDYSNLKSKVEWYKPNNLIDPSIEQI
jgi:hypothetical protein